MRPAAIEATGTCRTCPYAGPAITGDAAGPRSAAGPTGCRGAAPAQARARRRALGAYRWHSARKRRQWESVAICPGVFLVVLGDADTEARRVAREIESAYGGVK
jgi:hypothetical protein